MKKNMFFTNQVTYMHYTTGKKTRYITTKTLHVVQKYLSDLIKKSRVHTNSESLLFLIKVFSFIKFF